MGEPGRRNHRARKGILAWRWGRAPEPRASHELLGGGPAGRWRCALGVAGGAGPAESPPPAAPSPHRLLSLRSCSRSPAPSRSPGRGPLVCAAPPPAPPPPLATMAHWGPSRAPKGTGGPTARAPSPGAPPPLRSPRLRPLLLLLLLLLGTCGAAWRSPEPGRLGPHAELTRAPRSPPAESGGSEDRQARGTEPGAPGPSPGPAPGPGEEDGATATGYRRWERAAPLAGVASRAQVSLISTSFVLKGDATHNQAMVHWTGENSSVSDLHALAAAPTRDTTGRPAGTATAPTQTPLWSSGAFLATWALGSPRRRPYWPLVTGYLGRGPQILALVSPQGTFPQISGSWATSDTPPLASRSWVMGEVARGFGSLQVLEGHPSSALPLSRPGSAS